MKRILAYIIILVYTLGCSKFLDKDPLGEVSESTAFETESDVMSALVAVYNVLLNFPGVGHNVNEIISDNALKGGEGPSDNPEFNEIAFSSTPTTNYHALQIWSKGYLGVHRANVVLEKIPSINMDENVKHKIIAETKFLRAYFYFILVQHFGDVPLITATNVESTEIERDSKELVYELIEKDLSEAAEVLPLKSQQPSNERGRITKGAAQAYLAQAFLFQKKFQEAEIWFNKVISSHEYSLDPDYSHMFRNEAKFGEEAVFEINYKYNPKYSNQSNKAPLRMGSAGMYGWGFCCPTQDFVDAFEPGDPRLWQSVYKQGDVMPDGKIADIGNSETPYMNKKAYLLESEFPVTGNPSHAEKNDIRVRYGMVLLWYAECANENGNTQDALNALNLVRARARQGNASVLPDVTVTDKNALRSKIWDEQRVEYGLENYRFFDLVRQGRAGTVLRAYSVKYNSLKGKNFKDGMHEVLPIPQTEIDLSQNKLTQNNGYQ